MTGINEIIKTEKAKKDSIYEGSKNDLKPAAAAGLTGGIVGNLASTLKDNPSLRLKRSSILGGLALGATGGFMANNNKVEKQEKARVWLARKEEEKLTKTSDESPFSTDGAVEGVKSIASMNRKATAGEKEVSNKEMIGNAAVGAGLGGLIGRLAPMGGSKMKTAALGALTGVVDSGVSDKLTNKFGKSDEKNEKAAKSAAAFGIAAGTTPILERGFFYGDKKWAKQVAKDKAGTGFGKHFKTHFANDRSGAEIAGRAKNLKQATKGMGKSILGRSAGGALIGGALSYGLSSLGERNDKN